MGPTNQTLARRAIGALLGVVFACFAQWASGEIMSPAHFWRNTWQGDHVDYGSYAAAMSGGGSAFCSDPRNAALSGCAPLDNGYISIQMYEGGPWEAVSLIGVYEAYVCPAGYQLYPSWTENGVTLTPACQRDGPAPPAPPPPGPPLGCASGEGGFLACPGNSPPSGSPTGPAQNFGSPSPTPEGEGPPEPWTSPFSTVLGGSKMCKPPDAVGDPVMAGTGNVYHVETDYTGPGPAIVRSYNSASPGWVHNHMIRVIANTTLADVVRPDGRMLTFTGSGTGAWRSNATVVERLEKLANGWRFTTADDTVEIFDAAGLPVSSTPRHGRVTRYETANARVQAVVDSFGRRLAIQYDAAGHVAAMVAADGQRIAYTYDDAGRLAGVTHADGTARRYVYEQAGQPLLLTGVVDERGVRFASWAYDPQGRAVSAVQAGSANGASLSYAGSQTTVVDGLGQQRTLAFADVQGRKLFAGHTAPCAGCSGDAAQRGVDPATGLMTGSTDFLGVTTLFTWDASRRLPTSTTRAAGWPEQQVRTTEWHPVFRLPVRIEEPGLSTVNTYDERGNLLREAITDTASGETRGTNWTYTREGLVQSMQDAAGATWRYEYDGMGQLAAVLDPLGRRTTFVYDGAGRMASRTEPNGLVTSFRYDVRGRILSREAAGETATFDYHPTGLLRTVTLPSGVGFTYGYDAAHRLTEIRDSRGAVVTFALDAVGNRIREEVRDGSGNLAMTRSRQMSATNRVLAESDALGAATSFAYDANGVAVGTTDALGQLTAQSLDALGRVTRTTFADASAATMAWDALDQLVRVTDPKGVSTNYTVNGLGNVTRETSPDSGGKTVRFDARGDPVETVDALGRKISITRDALGRPTRIEASDQAQTFTYDAAGSIESMSDGSGSTSYTRDVHGRVLEKVQATEGVTHRVAYAYANGEPASIRYPDGLQIYLTRTNGRITQLDIQPPGKPRSPFITGLQYTALGQPKAWNWSTGDSSAWTFDTNGRPASNEIASWRYDAAGRITGVTQQLWTQGGKGNAAPTQTPVTWGATYDNRNRLTGFSREGASTAYTYDANGNRTSAVETASSAIDLEGLFIATGNQTVSQAHNIDPASNRLLGFTQTMSGVSGTLTTSATSRVDYGIDAAGSITSDGLRTFENDGTGRFSKTIVSKDGEAAAVIYRHNAFGQRVFKSDPTIEDTLPDETNLGKGFVDWLKANFGWLFGKGKAVALPGTGYVYDEAGNLLAEADAAGHRTDYIWLPLDGGGHVLVGFYKDGQLHAVHTDHLGTPRLVTDTKNRPEWQWPYSAFGANRPIGLLEAVSASGKTRLRATEPGTELNLRFAGQYSDAESNLNQNWHREYDPRIGRYRQFDPSGLRDGPNGYAYVAGNPLRFADPKGLTRQDVMNALELLRGSFPDMMFPQAHEVGFDALIRIPLIAPNPRAHFSKFTRRITMDNQFLGCLSPGGAQGMLLTLLHEALHYNQTPSDVWTTGPNHDRFDDEALSRLMNHPTILKEFEKKREECICRR